MNVRSKISLWLCATPLLLAAAARPALAGETLEGTWIGNMYSQRGPIRVNPAFNWQTGKWGITPARGVSWASWLVTLEITGSFKNLSGTYLAADKANAKNRSKYAFDGNFNFAKMLMTWQPDAVLEGKTAAADTVIRSLTYSQDGNFEYLKGRWASQAGDVGIMEFRRAFDGNPLKDEAAPAPADFMLPEVDTDYVIKKGDFFLALNDAQDGITSKTDAGEDARKWKFEAAGDAFPKSFRIVPSGKDGQCLVPADGDEGGLVLADKADSPEGDQFWRFETSGDGVMITNVKNGGRALFINDEGSGQTIIRSRNEAHENKWALEKQ